MIIISNTDNNITCAYLKATVNNDMRDAGENKSPSAVRMGFVMHLATHLHLFSPDERGDIPPIIGDLGNFGRKRGFCFLFRRFLCNWRVVRS